MGFWEGIKQVGLVVKCSVGWHAGEYEHVKGKPQCFLAKTCPDCKKYVTKNEHEFDSWEYQDYNSCRQFRTCIHCKFQETEIIHNYEERGKDSQCKVIEVCTRCGDKKLGRTDHNWIQIPFTNKDISVNGKKKCKDCGYVG